ncbi:MAG: tetratricopeptide repeat protein [Candidatus Aminicenantes bacterium]|jgi:tetratricopeptide (TPR) repeat protein
MKVTNKKTIYSGIFILILLFSFWGCGEKSPEAWYSRGVALSALGRPDQALEAYNKAIEIKPDNHEAWYKKGWALDKLSRHEDALEAYNKAIKIKPNYDQAWFNKGVALEKLGRKKEAQKAFEKADEIKKKPKTK